MNASLFEVLAIAVLALFGIGFYGLLTMRHLIRIIVAMQILEKCVLLALILASRATGDIALGQSMAVTVIVVDTIVAVVALALAVRMKAMLGTLDIHTLSKLRG